MIETTLKNIPKLNDEKLRRLFLRAIEYCVAGKDVDDAERIIDSIQTEWAHRLIAFRAGKYKATTPQDGMLSAVGYHVGIVQGKSEPVRHKLLDYIITGTLPPAGSPPYYEEWGEPLSKTRYRKLHRVITVQASSNDHFENRDKAVTEWRNDLLYLQQNWKAKVV